MRDEVRPELLRWAEAQIGRATGWARLAGDGSDKLFWRLTWTGGSLVAVDGSSLEPARFPENSAFLHIGRHLAAQGVPVPRIAAQNAEKGFFLIEDLGDELLTRRAKAVSGAERERLYGRVIDLLLEMQTRGAEGFQTRWCAQTGYYDREMVLKYESCYFLRAFAQKYCEKEEPPSGLEEELALLAGRAAQSKPVLFLHRDFQSRNIMLQGDRIMIIDFQGGRLGPPGYDLASLLLDPYVGLCPDERGALLTHYLDRAGDLPGFNRSVFEKDYLYLALHRTMQMLGAFAFLSLKKNRPGFREYLGPALMNLKEILAEPEFIACPVLKGFVRSLGLESC